MALRIYTKTGDDGTTGLFGGGRTVKDSLRIESCGTVDELNCAVGLARSQGLTSDHDQLLATVQDGLFILGADLAAPRSSGRPQASPRVTDEDIVCLERAIDRLEGSLPKLTMFILPGGSISGATIHLARAICRRAERIVVRLAHEEPEIGDLPQRYLNRLSDFLFVLARSANAAAGVGEHPWQPTGAR